MVEKTKSTPEEVKAKRQAALAKARAVRLNNIKNKTEKVTPMVTMKLVHAFEQLDAIEKATGEDKIAKLKEYGTKAPLNFLLSMNYNSDIKLEIPSGLPSTLKPNEVDTATHPDMMGQLSANIARLKYCVVGNKIKKFKKEEIFIGVMLSCPWKDAEILCACKDRALTELYPSVTKQLVNSVFSAYVK
jgi:hypothetical protein